MTTLDFGKECKTVAHVDGGAGVLCCYLASDHDGLHWDKADGVWWSTEDPAEVLDESQRWQIAEARRLLARFDADEQYTGMSRAHALADHLRGLLALLGEVAPEPKED